MKILVAGAGGQLGQALPQALKGHEVEALDHARLDITQLNAVRTVIERIEPALVINAAAYNHVDEAESDPLAAYRVNALGPRNLSVITAAYGVPILHVSTDYVFAGTSTRPYHEFDYPHPLSVYGESKLAGEEAVRTLNARHYIVRTAWLFDVQGHNFLKTMCHLAQQQPEVQVVNDQHGSPTYVPHLAEALARVVGTHAYGTYHLAGHGGTTRYELTRFLYRLLSITTPICPVTTAEFPRAAKRPAYSILTTIQEPHILLPTWEEGVRQFAERIREYPQI